MKADFHMHTFFSSDSQSSPEEMVEGAIQKGLTRICITDHQDVDYPDRGYGEEFRLNLERYVPTILQLKEQYKEKIDILLGVEFGLQPHLGPIYQAMAAKYPFDFIIGSVHLLDGKDPYYGEYFSDKTDEEGYRRAFQLTMENLRAIRTFDSLGHIDYVVRYGKKQEDSYQPLRYMDEIDEILKYLIQNEKALEVNTAGWKYGLTFAHPHQAILRRYKELGGEMITIGSDGHKPEHIAYDFARIGDYLRECGFNFYTEFCERRPLFMELP